MKNDAEVLKGLEQLFIEVIDKEGGGKYEDFFLTRSREGLFSPALVMWLMICQRVQPRRSLVGALESLGTGSGEEILSRNKGSKRVARGEVSLNSGGLSRARSKIKLEQVHKVCELINTHLMNEHVESGYWHSKRVCLVDGTQIALGEAEAIQERFPGHHNQHGKMHGGTLLCMCFHDLFSGIAVSPHYGAYCGSKPTSEQKLYKEMISKLSEPTLLVGDRNFGVIALAFAAQRYGHEVLFRLKEDRAENLLGRCLGKQDIDERVTWRPTPTMLKKHPELKDAEVAGRFIQKTVRRRGCKPLVLLFFTTSEAPKRELLELYRQRERIENDIRSIKYSLGLEMLYGQTPDIIEKELLLGFAAYNLVRALLVWAAKKLKIKPRQISFSRGAELTRIFGNKMRGARTAKEQKEITRRFLTGINQSKLPSRSVTRMEPRKLARKKKRFPLMKASRQEERQLALKCLAKHGHRGYTSRNSAGNMKC